MRSYFEGKIEKENQIKKAKKKYQRDVSNDILDRNLFKAVSKTEQFERSMKPNAMNKNVEKIYLSAQVRDYNRMLFKTDHTADRLKDYCHKAQYSEEVYFKRQKDVKERRQQTVERHREAIEMLELIHTRKQ